MSPTSLPELVPARMINEVLYCERLLYLEWTQGEFADNVYTVDGRTVHQRADTPGGRLPPLPATTPADDAALEPGEAPLSRAASADSPPASTTPERPYQARSVWLSSESLGITAKIDIVQGDAEGTVVPIEYKRGRPPEVPERAYLPERAQVCAQVLLLREHGYHVPHGALYFAAAKTRVRIDIDPTLIDTTLAAVARAREVAGANQLPPPLCDSPKCDGCSLIGICLPDETHRLQTQRSLPPADPPPAPTPLRRLHPARDDQLPFYVQESGARVGLSGECLTVRSRSGETAEARLAHTSQVCLLGNVQMSTQALRALMDRGIPVLFFTSGGWYQGRTIGHDPKNIELRIAQHRAAANPEFCLRLARGLTAAKIRNCRTLLRRNAEPSDDTVLAELERLARQAEQAPALESLLGLEGTAARSYFAAFSCMLRAPESAAAPWRFELDGRNRRPPRDPVNALLSFAYALLAKDFAITLAAVGLDPMLGFYHQLRFGRPSLALDLMEEFRPLVADSVVLGLINTGAVVPDDFLTTAGAVALRPAGRKRFLQAYETRMDQLITHPVFGYRISYRRVLEVQARLLGRLLLGEITEYPSFRTR